MVAAVPSIGAGHSMLCPYEKALGEWLLRRFLGVVCAGGGFPIK